MKEMFITFEKLEEMELEYTLEDNGMSGRYVGYHWYTAVNDSQPEDIIEVYVK